MQLFLFAIFVFYMITMTGCDNTSETSQSKQSQDNPMQHHDHNRHDHGTFELTTLDSSIPKPEIQVTAQEDAIDGWNIHIKTKYFIFAPEHVNMEPVLGEGHAHILVDGYKLARIYGNWYHLKKLTPGKHVIRITLNANNHSELSYKGGLIETTATITQQ